MSQSTASILKTVAPGTTPGASYLNAGLTFEDPSGVYGDSHMQERDWSKAPLGDLITHLETAHHAYLKEQLPRISLLAERVATAYGDRYPELYAVAVACSTFRSRMEQHLLKEELLLFPLLRELEQGGARLRYHHEKLGRLVRAMNSDHEEESGLLGKLCALTRGFASPADGSTLLSFLLETLAAVDENCARHLQEEEEILLPRAAVLIAEAQAIPEEPTAP